MHPMVCQPGDHGSCTALHHSSSHSSRSTSTTFRDGCTYDEMKNFWYLNALWQYKYMGAWGYAKSASSSDLVTSPNPHAMWIWCGPFGGRLPLVISGLHRELCRVDGREYQHKSPPLYSNNLTRVTEYPQLCPHLMCSARTLIEATCSLQNK